MSREFIQPDVAEFFSLHERRNQLQDAAAKASDLTVDLIDEAMAAADQRIEALAQNTNVREHLQKLLRPVIDEVSGKIAELDTVAKLSVGLVSESTIEDRRKSLWQSIETRANTDPRLKIALTYSGSTVLAKMAGPKHGDQEMVTQPEVESGLQTNEPEQREVLKPCFKITRRGKAIMIGKSGKLITTSDLHHPGHRDYSEERVAVLRTLVKNQGTMLNANALWEQTFPDVPFEGRTMAQVRVWFDKLTYRRQQVVTHNGKRGRGSAYGIMSFDVEFFEEQVVRATEQVSAPAIVPETADAEIQQSTSHPYSHSVPESKRERQTAQAKSLFPLSLYEASVLGTFIQANNEVLKDLGINTLEENIVDNIVSQVTPEQRRKAVLEHGDIFAIREAAIKKIAEFFSSDDLLLECIATMSEQDQRYDLFAYLLNIEGEDRWKLLEELVSAERGIRYTADTGRRQSYAIDHDSMTRIIGNDAYPITCTPTSAPTVVEQSQEVANQTQSDDNSVTVNELAESSQILDLSEEIPTDITRELLNAHIPSAEPSERDIFATELRNSIREWLQAIQQYSLDGKPRPAIQGVFQWFTPNAVKNASENNHISRSSNTLSTREILTINAMHLAKDAFSVLKSKQRPDRKLIMQVIDEELKPSGNDN